MEVIQAKLAESDEEGEELEASAEGSGEGNLGM